MKLFMILFFILMQSMINSQSLMELFKNDLCNEIKNNSEINRLVTANLNAVEAVHPELLYYYIVAYNEQFGNSPVPTDNFDNSDLVFIKNEYLNKINKWFEIQLKYLENSNNDTNLYNFEKKYFEDNTPVSPVELKISSNKIIEIDKNMMDYFVIKYYLNDSKLIYNLNENYTEIRNDYEMEQKIRLKIYSSQLVNNEIMFYQAECYFNDALKLWFLFNSDNSSTKLAEFVKLMLVKKFENTGMNDNKLTLSLGFSIGSTKPFKYTLNIPGIIFPISNENIILDFNQISVNSCYSFILRDVKSLLSKLDVNVAYSYQQVKQFFKLPDLNQMPPETSTSEELYYHRVTFSKNNIELKSYQTFSFYFQAPILFITNELALSFGGRVDYNIFYYSTEFSYTYKYFKAYYNNGFYSTARLIKSSQADIPKEEGTQSYYEVYPFINFEFNPINNLYIDFNLYPKRYSIQLGYAFL